MLLDTVMERNFYILLSLKTPADFCVYGEYFLGNDRELACELFNGLKGSNVIRNDAMLHLDLMETIEDLPVKVKTISCTLDEMVDNCRLLTREIFLFKNLRECK